MIDSRAASPVEFSCKFDKGTYSLSAGIDLTSLPNQFVWIARVSPFWALELQVCSLPPSLCDFWGSELQPLSSQGKYFIHWANPTLPNNFFSKVISYFVRSLLFSLCPQHYFWFYKHIFYSLPTQYGVTRDSVEPLMSESESDKTLKAHMCLKHCTCDTHCSMSLAGI